jgi:flagellar P-ring protein precursor FlgI
LVIGLPGTGDGAKNKQTVQALGAALARLNQPTALADLKNADNVALVMVEASVPKAGVKRGQKIDAYVSSVLGAKSLRGGRLLSTPLTVLGDSRQKTAVALASGAMTVEDAKLATTARLPMGVDLLTEVRSHFVKADEEQQMITLLIDPAKASFWTSSEVANAINYAFNYQAEGKKIARAVAPGSVEVMILPEYRDQAVEFIAEVLEVGIDNPHTQARVILNSSTGAILVTGEVEISPVVITHKNFNIEVGADEETEHSGRHRSG